MSEREPGFVQIPLTWVDLDETPIEFANQFLIQHQPQEFILTIGQLAPPPLLGSPEDQQAQAANLTFVPIQTLGRYGLTRHRLVELIQVLQANLETYDRTQAEWGQQP